MAAKTKRKKAVPQHRDSAFPKIGCIQHDCAVCRRRESARREAEVRNSEEDFLRDAYPTHDAALEELRDRIDEVLAVRQDLEREREKRAPRALTNRIRELERDLATVNERLTTAQTALLHNGQTSSESCLSTPERKA